MNKAISNFLGNRKGTTRKPKNELKASHSKIQRINPKKKPSNETLVEHRPGAREREKEAEQQSTAASQSVRQKPVKPKKPAKKEETATQKPTLSLKTKGTSPSHPSPVAHTPIIDDEPKIPLANAPSFQNITLKKGVSREAPSTRTNLNIIHPVLTTSTSTVSCTASSSATTHDATWIGASAAKTWMEKTDFAKTKSEFDKITSMVVDVEKDCKKWKANAKLNQSDEYPVLDSKLVKADDYVNMSHVDVPLHRNILIGQVPLPGSEEAFWKVVFDQRAMRIHLLLGDDEKIEFFPQRSGDFMHYGSMFVNNRKTENISDDIVRFAIEVLPAGCSNSIITSFTVIKNWSMDSVHSKYACVLKEAIELNNFLSNSQPDETALVMSKNGAGRPGYFIALTISVTKMDQKIVPDVLEIVKSIRSQRPRAVDSLPQYASLYISLFYFIKRKMSTTAEGDKKAMADPNEPLCKRAIQLTNQFTAGLMEAAAAQSTKSTMTSIP